MDIKQMNMAMNDMTEWLAHPAELGKPPAKIECAGEFDLYDLHYYIFKYKKSMWGKWLLGVSGGYEGDELENCGHVFSKMELYDEETAVEMATELVESLRSYLKEQAERAEEQKKNPGNFVNFVLLEKSEWDKEAIVQELKERWQIEDETEADEQDEYDGEESESEQDYTIVMNYNNAIISVALMQCPIPDGEAEISAEKNYLWHEAADTIKGYKAHIIVGVLKGSMSPVEAGILLVKVVATCCRQAGVLGVYANETVYQPEYYMHFAEMISDELFPIYNLVWFGLYKGKNGLCGYTCGMRDFGYDEMEVLDSAAKPQELVEFLSDIASYVITENVILKDGETIGFTAEQKIPITKSNGVAVEGDSLKIEL